MYGYQSEVYAYNLYITIRICQENPIVFVADNTHTEFDIFMVNLVMFNHIAED